MRKKKQSEEVKNKIRGKFALLREKECFKKSNSSPSKKKYKKKRKKELNLNWKVTKRFSHKYYIHSKKWWEFKKYVKTFFNNTCQCCGYTKKLQVHHHHYKTLWNESISDVTLVCWKCHTDIHFIDGYKLPLTEEVLLKSFCRVRDKYK